MLGAMNTLILILGWRHPKLLITHHLFHFIGIKITKQTV